MYKFFIKAPYETLLSRVRSRDKAKSKETDINRFDEVHNIVNSKEFDEFKIIETDKSDIREVADTILKIIRT